MGNTITRFFGRAGALLSKHSPAILTGVGVAGLVGAGVWACIQTKKTEKVALKHKAKLMDLHGDREKMDEKTYKKALVKVYATTGLEYTKIYALPFTLAALSVTSILVGHNVLNKRHAAVSAAYNTLTTAFTEYRNRVIDDMGKDKDIEYLTGAKKIATNKTKNDDGETVVENVYEGNKNTNYSPYTFFFDESSTAWTRDPLKNKVFLINQQNAMNDLLRCRGHVFLNEVLEAVGLPHTPAGAVTGWIRRKSGDNGGDNYIDFGLGNIDNPGTRLFANGQERSVMLDFNVDGVMYDLI